MRNAILGALMGVLATVTIPHPADAQSYSSRLAAVDGVSEETPVAEFGTPISTSFSTYRPYRVPTYRAQVGAGEATPAANFSNVATASGSFPWSTYFSAQERSMLQKNGFMARPEPVGSFGQAYAYGSPELGSFVTVDAILHGLHVTADEAYRDLERGYISANLASVLSDLSSNISAQLSAERSPAMSEALSRLLAYVQTGQRLLDPSARIDSRVKSAVESELAKIRAASEVSTSTILPESRIDYSIFQPTGHYALGEEFQNYYQARTWLSHVGLEMRSTRRGPVDLRTTRMAALLARTMDALAAQSGDFADRYLGVYETLAFFSGRSERDITWDMMASSVRGYYGRAVAASSSPIADDAELERFVAYAESQLPTPAYESGGTRAFRLINIGFDPSRSLSGSRSIGLELMAANQNSRAASLVGSEGSARAGSVSASSLFDRPTEEWVQSIHMALLYTVKPLTSPVSRGDGYPRFMRSEAWRDRELASSLGAWADFEHDVMTRSMTSGGRVVASSRGSELESEGYVEPNPEAWARVASLAGYLRSGLVNGHNGVSVSSKIGDKLRDIENASAICMQIAVNELAGRELTSDQLELLASIESRIAAYETFTDKSLKGEGATVVAGTVGAEEKDTGIKSAPATGHPMVLYVIVPRNDGERGLMLTRGAVYSYYETASSSDAWQQTMMAGSSSAKPDLSWMGSWVSGERAFAQDASKFRSVEGTVPAAARYTPTAAERKQAAIPVQLELETNVVRSSAGELWYTINAPALSGSDIVAVVVDRSGQVVQRTTPGRIENGKRYDMIRADALKPGQYFVRITDLTNQTLASSRFLVVR